ncbi:lipid II:glycine glycyltransferase FemX [Sediminispirochaeta bajacaliforniensis]|uniref:lipid II:glycine glycyltransferase FemX n=1 Tax=Sediminispirochaeta bajacaliforniensis TaxID=148 RepID=UPI0003696F82|nr:peptidoglycan bridge formation glycyltransferase FemA/FemB family protein [Sediminispirochaeta bajacaliforniensis]
MSVNTDTIEVRPIPLESFEGDRLLQSRFWARLKGLYGWKAFTFRVTAVSWKTPVSILVLYRHFMPGAAIAYAPHPSLPSGSGALLANLSRALKEYLPYDTLLLRWDLPWPLDTGSGSAAIEGLRPSPVDIQPPNTVLIDLNPDEDQLLSEMKSKTRYNVRLASRKGVEVSSEGVGGLSTWYDLYRETAERDRIAIHPESYYRSLFRLVKEHPQDGVDLELLMARTEGRAIAGIIVSRFAGKATYLYGASSNSDRNLMPAYALQWRAMTDAKASGCVSYDLFGIPPADDPSHPMHGLYRFKTGFGGIILHRFGSWDYALRSIRAGVYRSLERLRRWYFLEYKKRK